MTTKRKIYLHLARLIQEQQRTKTSCGIESFVKEHLPSGSGFDAGTQYKRADFKNKNLVQIVLGTSFHHMNDNGMYDGWTEHNVYVIADFEFKFSIRVSGPNRNGIRDYIKDTFHEILSKEIDIEFEKI